jgi:hypothetical protein
MVRAGYKEKDMSKTNDTSKFRIEDIEALDLGGDAACTGRILRDDELEKVSGGCCRYTLFQPDVTP